MSKLLIGLRLGYLTLHMLYAFGDDSSAAGDS